MLPPTLILGIITLAGGAILLYWLKRRRFNRTTQYGTEGFRNFETKVATRFLERIGKWLAYILVILGALFLWSYWSQKKREAPLVSATSFTVNYFSPTS